MNWFLIALGADVLILALGLMLQPGYLRHLRHHHRPHWESMNRQSPRSWRYFKGMPTTGLLIATIIGNPDYKAYETTAQLWNGRFIVLLNLLHVIALAAIVLLAVAHFLL